MIGADIGWSLWIQYTQDYLNLYIKNKNAGKIRLYVVCYNATKVQLNMAKKFVHWMTA